jgi:hypothetical protein
LPFAVTIYRVSAYHKNFSTKFLKCRILDGNCRHFRWSDHGEITDVEKKYDPFPSVLGEMNFRRFTLLVDQSLKIRCHFSNSKHPIHTTLL